jgi:microcystin-dependent protein
MSQPYIGEIRLVGFNFAPVDWALCNGALLSISQNAALFSLLGTTYGGDGINTFALPNLQSRVAIHLGTLAGASYPEGQYAGVENVTLTTAQMPSHNHSIPVVAAAGNAPSPAGALIASAPEEQFAAVASATSSMGNMVAAAGSSQPHSNIQPYLALNYIIALYGIFPSQN